MAQRRRLILRSTAALVAGALAFIALSTLIVNVRLRTDFDPAPWLGLTLTLLLYAVPGVLVGLLSVRRPMLDGAVLGLLTVPVSLYHVGGQSFWLFSALVEMWDVPLVLGTFGVVLCCTASVFAHRVFRLRARNL